METTGNSVPCPHVRFCHGTATSVHVQAGCSGQQLSSGSVIGSGPLRDPPRSPPQELPACPERSLPRAASRSLSCLCGSAAAPMTRSTRAGLTMEPSPSHLSPITGSHTAETRSRSSAPKSLGEARPPFCLSHYLAFHRLSPGTTTPHGAGASHTRLQCLAARPSRWHRPPPTYDPLLSHAPQRRGPR